MLFRRAAGSLTMGGRNEGASELFVRIGLFQFSHFFNHSLISLELRDLHRLLEVEIGIIERFQHDTRGGGVECDLLRER